MTRRAVIAWALAALASLPLLAQGADREAVLAGEEFRRGVQAYDRYAFNEAILSFEKALGYRSDEPLILERLGGAYYRSGLEDTALRQWQAALDRYAPTSSEAILLRSRIETVRLRRSLYPDLSSDARYVEAGRYPSRNGDTLVYGAPTAVLPQPDGSVWVAAYGSNELVRIDANGVVRSRSKGPINGFDRPYDVIRGADGRLFVSEQRGDRISVLDPDGTWRSYIGGRGRGDGQFVGPQNLAVDEQGYLYVVDWGNRRIVKFDPDGAWVLSFGAKTASFSGFLAPTGIAALGGRVYVADAARKALASFDSSGNFEGWVGEGTFSYPESLRSDGKGRLIVADTSRIVLFDPGSGASWELGRLGNAGTRIVSADLDANGGLVAANYAAGEVSVLARADDLASGLFVQIQRVISDRFPRVTVELSVQDRSRRPVVGLQGLNFMVSEEGRPAAAFRFEGAGYLSRKVDAAILVERSSAARTLGADFARAAGDLAAAVDRVVTIVSAGDQPVKEPVGTASRIAESVRVGSVTSGSRWRFDLALRLAASELIPGEKKRAVFFLCTGELGDRAFDRYGLSELAGFLANNEVAFFPVLVGDGQASAELRYLADQSGGKVLSAFSSQGLAPAVQALREGPSSSYLLSYESALPTDFGRAYLPVEVEAYLLSRSGRDATGYFAPLQ